MSEPFDKAIARARQLPADRQNAIATLILDEIEDDARWDVAFANSPDVLEQLAVQADDEDRKGLTRAHHEELSSRR
ncbi:MAG: hypothetical protein F4201_09475 [Nitrospira sp. SB0677_bin_15]|nr:hypothetical protein [Nitrospira sp. SB0667_bin_9]MYD31283.1 hypothetical protein [Nitrospira sp. SB0661_bin_20]MYG41021.1 hypothetical protein [Nitrospira sp. SB0677_bin_15]MYH01142.1 hypothetical protein [Nitrospira sp. SB0675_bin_23]MYJ22085.1 hypothetical protein [Nitrospira sp. SB0673_bin_12]